MMRRQPPLALNPHVALFTDSDAMAGTERHMLDLANDLPNEGIQVTIACPGQSPLAAVARQSGIPILEIEKRGLVDKDAIAILARHLRPGADNSATFDIVHAHNGRTALLAAMAVTFAGCGRFVYTQHFLTPSHTERTGPRALVDAVVHRWVGNRAAAAIAISGAVMDRMLERREVDAGKLVVIPNGVRIPSTISDATGVRAVLGIPTTALFIFCAARLEPEKDVRTLIDAIHRLGHDCPDAVCLIAGDGTERTNLARQIDRLDLGNKVRLLGYRTDVGAIMAACDVFVLPSLAEPFGLSILEAMSMGKPVIATDAGGPREIVTDLSARHVENGPTGILVPAADSDALAKAIRRLATDPRLRSCLGENGRDRFHERFTASRMAVDTAAAYRSAIGIAKATTNQ